jgi:hypothetical protein
MELTEKAKQARREYENAWRRKNRDRVKQYNAQYWEKRARKIKEAGSDGGDKQAV